MHSESFKAGLIKAANEAGGDGAYIEGFLKEASVLGESIDFFINEAEKQSNDPEFRTKLAAELLPLLYGKEKAALYAPLFVKEAEGWLDDIGSYFNQGGEWVGTQLGNMFAEKGNQESMDKYKSMGSGILGGGVGALGGLLLGKGLNISPIAGALVGGLLGGAAGHFGNEGYLKKTTGLTEPRTGRMYVGDDVEENQLKRLGALTEEQRGAEVAANTARILKSPQGMAAQAEQAKRLAEQAKQAKRQATQAQWFTDLPKHIIERYGDPKGMLQPAYLGDYGDAWKVTPLKNQNKPYDVTPPRAPLEPKP